ncbi:hypothetical protein CHARACLAT_017432 [Characodon lateralis]|uniref:Uncharacterized protein n=1 Tax=Characodon lateralis TaxID=208331 RepID=A0ABU7DHL2_9TELE|nr:hypothetical protein [Characodon lateralis]
MSSADKRGCTWLKVLKSEASEGDWMKSHADRMLIGWQGDAQKGHWKEQSVKDHLQRSCRINHDVLVQP